MTRTSSPGRSLLRLAVVGAVATGAPLALAGTASAAPESAWDKLAQCESGGNWSINSGNGYYGGIQFNPRTWRAFGGTGMPHQASKAQQIAVAERTLAAQGWGAWPACSRKMGLRGHDAEPGKTVAPKAKKASAPAKSGGGNYVVKRGDTLSKIAKAHGKSVKALAAANGLANAHVLKVGRTLSV
jgi:LysM repeat protein